jgi:hypothetical protein
MSASPNAIHEARALAAEQVGRFTLSRVEQDGKVSAKAERNMDFFGDETFTQPGGAGARIARCRPTSDSRLNWQQSLPVRFEWLVPGPGMYHNGYLFESSFGSNPSTGGSLRCAASGPASSANRPRFVAARGMESSPPHSPHTASYKFLPAAAAGCDRCNLLLVGEITIRCRE